MRHPRTLHQPIADRMRQQPGEWQQVQIASARYIAVSTAYGIRHGKTYKAYAPAASFEAEARFVDGEWTVWARYVGAEVAS